MEPKSERVEKYRIKKQNGYFWIQRLIYKSDYSKFQKWLGCKDYEVWRYCSENNQITDYEYAWRTTEIGEARKKKKKFEEPTQYIY